MKRTRVVIPLIIIVCLDYFVIGYPAFGCIGIVYGLFYLLVSIIRWNKALIRKSVIVFLLFALEVTTVGFNSYHEIFRSKEDAKEIISALESYKSMQGNYPEELNQLPPSFIDEVPKTHMGFKGGKFWYIMKSDEYLLGFHCFGFLHFYYSSKDRRWGKSD